MTNAIHEGCATTKICASFLRPEPPRGVTAVQLRADREITASLICGAPVGTLPGSVGEIALLPPGQVAAYLVRGLHRTGFYLFRTVAETGGPLTLVPGLHAPVRIFLSTAKRGVVTRTRNFLRKLTSYGREPSVLTDDFWTRAAGALVARARASRQLLPYLLQQEPSDQAPSRCPHRRHLHHSRLCTLCLSAHPELHPQLAARCLLASPRPANRQR
jgi:hypothetical protein